MVSAPQAAGSLRTEHPSVQAVATKTRESVLLTLYGIHWPDVDEDLSTEALLRGAPAPRAAQVKAAGAARRPKKSP